jgi:hypothetical protein
VDVATVVSTRQFDSMIKGLLSADELAVLEFSLAINPTGHPVIPGTNGVRKARWARPGSGKRGGIRVIYFYAISAEVVLLLAAYPKNEKEDLTSEDKKNIRRVVEDFQKSLTA